MGKKFSILFSVLTLAAIVSSLFTGCQPASVDFSKLTGNPSAYNGKTVTFEAYVFTGFEIQALSASLVRRPGTIQWIPGQPLIWMTGNFPQSVYDQLYTQSDTPSGYTEHYGRVRVTGKFEYGGRYGHLDAYEYLLTVTDAVYIEAILPP